MSSFGDKLKREREMRAITLEEISEATKIGTRSLKALEEEHFDQLPGGIFNKGFVRAYAKFLGLDEEQAVADYMTATNEVGTTTTMQMQALADEAERARAANEAAQESGGTGATIAVLIGLVILCGIGFGGYKAWKFKKDQAAVEAAQPAPRKQAPPPVALQTATPTDATAQPAPNADGTTATPNGTTPGATSPTTGTPVPSNATPSTPTGTTTAPSSNTTSPATSASTGAASTKAPETISPSTSSTGSGTKASKAAYPIILTLKAVKKAWVMVKGDGKVIYQNTMDPGDDLKKQITLHATDKMELQLGNAGGVEVTVNGQPSGTLGKDKEVKDVTITPQGIQK